MPAPRRDRRCREIGAGFPTLAVAHILGHATVRTLQFLRAPSMLHDFHQMHSASGGELSPTGKHLAELLPRPVELWLYRWAMDRGHLDTLLERLVVRPLIRISELLARIDRYGGPKARAAGRAEAAITGGRS